MKIFSLFIIFILISCIILPIFNVKSIPYDLWNNYKILNFDGGYEGLQVNFNITYGYGDNGLNFNCKENFEDLRFFNYEDDVLLYAYNETTINKDYCEIWLKLGSSTNVTMRYNNPEATSYWDLENTFNDVISDVVLALPMNEDLGSDVYDYSGFGNDGVVTGTSIVDGYFSGTSARRFYGNGSDYIIVSDSDSLDIETLTCCVWVQFHSLPNYVPQRVIDKERTSAYGFGIYGPAQYFGANIGGVIQSYSEYAYPDYLNSWEVFGVVANETTLSWFFNGSAYSYASFSPTGSISNNSYNLAIGSSYSGLGYYLNGTISCLFLFDAPKTDLEMLNLYSYYPDSSIIVGSVCCRIWVNVMPTVSFGIEYSNIINDAILIGVLGFIIALIALVLIITNKKK